MMLAFGIILVLIIGYLVMTRDGAVQENVLPADTDVAMEAVTPGTEVVSETAIAPAATAAAAKDFTMTSWMDTIDGKMAAHFSLKEIVVKKGDKVRITITNTAGDHDFNIDAYNIKSETPLNKVTVIEFTADKVGSFEYYCSKYSHRTIGQTGTLRVIE